MSKTERASLEDDIILVIIVLIDIADEQEKIMQELMDEENTSTLDIPNTSPQTHVKN